jgi:hypothetical protein
MNFWGDRIVILEVIRRALKRSICFEKPTLLFRAMVHFTEESQDKSYPRVPCHQYVVRGVLLVFYTVIQTVMNSQGKFSISCGSDTIRKGIDVHVGFT